MSEEPVSNESVNYIITKFQNHPSIIKIKENHHGHFSFSAVVVEDVDREIDSLDASKAIQQNDIPLKIIKANRDIFPEFIMHRYNKGISTAKFPDILKSTEVKPIFKKKSRIDKKDYRTEGWKECLDSNGACGALLTDFLKAFDRLPHSLMIAKLHAYGFYKTSTEYLKDYSSHRKQDYQDYNSSFKELLRKDSSVTIHQRNLKLLLQKCAPDIMKEIFEIVNRNYNFRYDD